MSYAELIERKRHLDGDYGFDAAPHDWLYDFQGDLVSWALRKGRAGIFADCGLGKTPMQLSWADAVYRHTGRPVLILTPLAVAHQTSLEADKFGIDASVNRNGDVTAPITITNYEQVHHFDPSDIGGIVCDESSVLKSFDGERRKLITSFMRKLPYRLLCTATAAPNDYTELGTSSEALGYLGYMDMLGRFFVNNMQNSSTGQYHGKRAEWRFKGHARDDFWRWVASWARAVRRPSDIGYSDDSFVLPALNVEQHIVQATRPREGALFDLPASNFFEEREEQRRTLNERCTLAAELLMESPAGIAWCHLNDEADLLEHLIPGAVQVSGSDPPDVKERKLLAFADGSIPYIVTKPIIGAWGLNWQHVNHMTFFPSHSYEQYYQAVRRSWRFGQMRPVRVDIVTTEGGSRALANLTRKSNAADAMFEQLVSHMNDAQGIKKTQSYPRQVEVPEWAT